ncbi:Zinc/iron permease [Backusella circina FSU 941]|nr:Zinc/iron permease [Backusella circina FSU 941]
MEPFLWLLLLSISMLFGSYVAGSLPLTTKLSENKIRLFNALGAGLLIGTSLMVVIPEGVETIYSSNREISSQSDAPTWTMDSSSDDTKGFKYGKRGEGEEGGEHTIIGLVLVIGFALMFVIDQMSSLHMHYTNNNNGGGAEYSELNIMVGGAADETEEQQQHKTPPPSLTPTVGLIVHAAADGIALGASATHPELSMVVFIAIMLHKAPASFALTSVLLASGLSRVTIRKHLLIFALAAPLGALLTYSILHWFSSSSSSVNLEYWTGVLLVFSGGTFLYVAMHALQEASGHSHHPGQNDKTHVFVILAGMIIPIVLNMFHAH